MCGKCIGHDTYHSKLNQLKQLGLMSNLQICLDVATRDSMLAKTTTNLVHRNTTDSVILTIMYPNDTLDTQSIEMTV